MFVEVQIVEDKISEYARTRTLFVIKEASETEKALLRETYIKGSYTAPESCKDKIGEVSICFKEDMESIKEGYSSKKEEE